MDYYLKFASEEEAKALLYRIEGAVEADPEKDIEAQAGNEVPNYANIDIIGTIYNDDAEFDEDGNIVTPATQLDGWYVNVRLVESENASTLEPYAVSPATPIRIWG